MHETLNQSLAPIPCVFPTRHLTGGEGSRDQTHGHGSGSGGSSDRVEGLV